MFFYVRRMLKIAKTVIFYLICVEKDIKCLVLLIKDINKPKYKRKGVKLSYD